jgi:hypothetical protein
MRPLGVGGNGLTGTAAATVMRPLGVGGNGLTGTVAATAKVAEIPKTAITNARRIVDSLKVIEGTLLGVNICTQRVTHAWQNIYNKSNYEVKSCTIPASLGNSPTRFDAK